MRTVANSLRSASIALCREPPLEEPKNLESIDSYPVLMAKLGTDMSALPQARVLVSLDLDPASTPELAPYYQAVMLQLKRKGVKMVIVETAEEMLREYDRLEDPDDSVGAEVGSHLGGELGPVGPVRQHRRSADGEARGGGEQGAAAPEAWPQRVDVHHTAFTGSEVRSGGWVGHPPI